MTDVLARLWPLLVGLFGVGAGIAVAWFAGRRVGRAEEREDMERSRADRERRIAEVVRASERRQRESERVSAEAKAKAGQIAEAEESKPLSEAQADALLDRASRFWRPKS